MNKFYCDNLKICDEYGRQRIFRGVNICCKLKSASSAEQLRKQFKKFENENISSLKNSGVNLVRLGITWAALEEKRGEYSRETACVLHDFVKQCEKEDIYVMPDMHQDLFSHYFHGDGAPEWAVNTSYKSKRPLAVWAEGYFYMNGVQQAFADFWKNKNNIQSDFINCWKFLVSSLGDCSNIIGCDFFNEPYPQSGGREIFINILNGIAKILGKNIDFHSCFYHNREKTGMILAALKIVAAVKSRSGFKKIMKAIDDEKNFSLIVDGKEDIIADFSENYYQPFFEKISKEVNCGLNVFEHSYYSNLGIPFSIEAPENSVYSPHAYDIFVDSPFYNIYCSNNRLNFILSRIRENQLKMNVPVIMGEWGGIQNGAKSIKHIDFIMNVFEKYQWSSLYWNMKFDDKKLLSVFNRPYPAAVFGDIKDIHTDSKERRFTLVWNQKEPCAEDSDNANIIYIPGRGFCRFPGAKGENRLELNY